MEKTLNVISIKNSAPMYEVLSAFVNGIALSSQDSVTESPAAEKKFVVSRTRGFFRAITGQEIGFVSLNEKFNVRY